MTKRSIFWFFILQLFFFSNSLHAGFYVIPGSRGVGTQIKTSWYEITQPGFYFLANDLSASCNGISVRTNDVTIDLMGFNIIGDGVPSGCAGIRIQSGISNVEIRNGTIRDFTWGIDGRGADVAVYDIRITGIRTFGNSSEGIALAGARHMVEDCIVSTNGSTGIRVGDFSTVIGSVTTGNGGSGISAGDGSTIAGNICNGNYTGIYASDYSVITNNTANGSTGPGSYTGSGIYARYGCTITGNSTNSNNTYGIYTLEGCTVSGNTARNNNRDGIRLSNSYVAQNAATDNNQSGESYENINCSDCTFGLNHRP